MWLPADAKTIATVVPHTIQLFKLVPTEKNLYA